MVLAAAFVGAVALEIHRAGAYFFVACDLGRLQPHALGRASYVYSADGTRFATLGATVVHTPVPLSGIAPTLQRATVAAEDRRFYHEGGTDWIAVLRAGVADITSASLAQGGSTLTQQLVRNLYLGDERTLGRKLEEGCLADQLARRWTKQRVLDAYLNTVYYGQQAYGVQAAAETYFSHSASRLTLPEAALLAGLPQAPSLYDPLRDPQAAKARRLEVLKAMLANGDIGITAYRGAANTPLGLKPSAAILEQQPESFFVNYLYAQLVARYGAATVRQGGLAIHATLDWHEQRQAERAIRTTLNRARDPAAALVAIEPTTGAVRAMASVVPGRPSYQFNLAVQSRRQAGSSFKLFVLTDAILRGIDPFTTTYLSAPFRGPPTNPYLIQTDTRTYTGRTPLDKATAQSDNTVFVRLTLDLGPRTVADTARRMGIASPLRSVDTIGLGVNPVSPFEMASAYATVADHGIYHQPYAVTSVTFANGHVDHWPTSHGRQVIPNGVAYQVTRVLEEVITGGTGTAANLGRPAAGKTGTTDSLADAWFDGYTPNLAAAVWVGYPQARVPMTDVHGIHVFGGTFPARIWRDFMTAALRNQPPVNFTQSAANSLWRPWCGPFQYALNYVDARRATRCTATGTTTTSNLTTTSTRATRPLTTTGSSSYPTTRPPTIPLTRTTTPLPPPTTLPPATTTPTTTDTTSTTTSVGP